MKIQTYKCVKQTPNKHMGVQCYSSDRSIFFFDKNGWVNVGDEVKIEKDDNGFDQRVWVNGILKQ